MSRLSKIFVCAAAACFGGCVSTSTFFAPDVVPPEQTSVVAAMVSYQGDGDSFATPVIGFRYGVADRIDIGAGFDMLTTRFDIRYQFLKSEQAFLDVTGEVGLGYLAFVIPTYYAGVIAGLDMNAIKPYVGYRHTFISGTNDDLEDDWDFTDGWGQLTIGVSIRVGKTTAIVPEFTTTTVKDVDTNDQLRTFGVGLRFGAF